MKVGITGANGFVGRHIQWFFCTKEDSIEPVVITRSLLEADEESLVDSLRECEVVLHCVKAHGKNTKEEDVYDTNIGLAENVISACEKLEKKPRIIFLSSIHAVKNETTYGKAMHDVGMLFSEYAEKNSTIATNLLVPHEFGEWGKPFHVSVVSTFCDQLVSGVPSDIDDQATVYLIHAQEVAQKVFELIHAPVVGDVSLKGDEISVSDLYQILSEYKDLYYKDVVPTIETPLHRALFNTLRSHIFTQGTFYPRSVQLHTDQRGSLFEMVKEKTGGQTFISTTIPGVTRGNHFHTRKIERFCVLQGEAEIKLRQPVTNVECSFNVCGSVPQYIDMPTFFAHNITNVGRGDLVTAFWCNEIFNPDDPDTYVYEV